MTGSDIWRWLGLGASLVLAGCVSRLGLDNSPCPCPAAAGFVCCSNGGAHCVHSLAGETAEQTCSRSSLDAGGMGGYLDAGGMGGHSGPTPSDALTRVGIPNVQSIAIGRAHACASYGEYQIACMGDNSKGQATPPPGFLYAVTAGDDFNCANKRDTVDPSKDGLVVCWGDNSFGQTTVPPGLKSVIAGGRHACGSVDGVSTVCWGDNRSGQATLPPGITRVDTLGRSHSCGLVFEPDAGYPPMATVRCWGDNSKGQATAPTVTLTDAPIGSVQIRASGDHTCVTTGYTTYCWGDNDQAPWVPPPIWVTYLAMAPGHACGISNSDGTIRCWGNDWGGARPEPPPGRFYGLWAGEFINCALTADEFRTALCWGKSYEVWPQ